MGGTASDSGAETSSGSDRLRRPLGADPPPRAHPVGHDDDGTHGQRGESAGLAQSAAERPTTWAKRRRKEVRFVVRPMGCASPEATPRGTANAPATWPGGANFDMVRERGSGPPLNRVGRIEASVGLDLPETIGAIDRAIHARLERHLSLVATR